jgi:hypothetical protein
VVINILVVDVAAGIAEITGRVKQHFGGHKGVVDHAGPFGAHPFLNDVPANKTAGYQCVLMQCSIGSQNKAADLGRRIGCTSRNLIKKRIDRQNAA